MDLTTEEAAYSVYLYPVDKIIPWSLRGVKQSLNGESELPIHKDAVSVCLVSYVPIPY
jgi:hypothetical protein